MTSSHGVVHRLFLLPDSLTRDPAVDAWLDSHGDALGAIARHWFTVMRDCGDGVRELMHDGCPTACVGEAAFAYVGAFKAHVSVGFFGGAELADPAGLLEGTGKFMRHVKLRTDQDIDTRALGALIESAYADTKRESNMAEVIRGITVEILDAFADAFNRHDADAVVSFVTEDCVFDASAGPEICGTRYAGRDAVRAAFAEVFATFPDAHWGGARHFTQGDRGVSEWTFTGTRAADGARVEVHGCDVFTFRDGKIAVKDSYRKNRPPRLD